MKNPLMLILIGVLAIAGVGIFSMQAMTSAPDSVDSQADAMGNTVAQVDQRQDSNSNAMDDMKGDTIVDIAREEGNFTTLVSAIEAADLAKTLGSEGPFTVFAPTDEAFAKLPEGTVDSLLEDKEKLAEILTYHVVAGRVMASDVVNLSSATTVQGQDVHIAFDGDSVMINDATVVATDVAASNGVIHVIDTVLMPE